MQTFILTDNIFKFDYILLIIYKSIQHNGDVSPEKRYRNTQERFEGWRCIWNVGYFDVIRTGLENHSKTVPKLCS